MQLRICDSRLGGYDKPITGVSVIDLTSKIPWCPDTYIAPSSDKFQIHDDSDRFNEINDGSVSSLRNEDNISQVFI